jgi:hypothetical protein
MRLAPFEIEPSLAHFDYFYILRFHNQIGNLGDFFLIKRPKLLHNLRCATRPINIHFIKIL